MHRLLFQNSATCSKYFKQESVFWANFSVDFMIFVSLKTIMSLSKGNAQPQKRINFCTLCRNHGKEVAKKGHKNCCPFEKDAHIQDCDKCGTYKKNQQVQTENMRIKRQAKQGRTPNTQTGRKRPMCQKCENHEISSLMMGHSKICEFRNCDCEECCFTEKHRRANSASIKSRRVNLKRAKDAKDFCNTSTAGNGASNASIDDDDTNSSDSGHGSSLVADSPDTSVTSVDFHIHQESAFEAIATLTSNPKLNADHSMVGQPVKEWAATMAGYDYDPDDKFDEID